MNHINLRLMGFVLLAVITAIILFYPVHVSPNFSPVQSLSDLNGPLRFGLLFSLFAALSLALGIYLARQDSTLAIVPIIIYAIIFLDYWTIKSPLPLTTEAPTNMGLVSYIFYSGKVNYSLGYLQYPLGFLFADIMKSVSGLSFSYTVLSLEISRPILFSLLFYMVVMRLGASKAVAVVSTCLATQGDVMLSRMPAFHAEVFGLLFFLLGISTILKYASLQRSDIIFTLFAIAAAMSYALGAPFLLCAIAGLILWNTRRGSQYKAVTFHFLALLGSIFLIWNLFIATQIPSVLSSFSLQIGQLLNPSHYYYLSKNVGANVLNTPSWIGYSTLASLGLLFGIPLMITLNHLLRRKMSALDYMIIFLWLPSIPLFAIHGGAEAERTLYYVAPFSAFMIVGVVLQSWSKWGVILVLLSVLLSFPNFLGYNAQANSNANYPQGLVAGEFVYSFYPKNQLPVYLSSGLIGMSGSFLLEHQIIAPDYSFFQNASSFSSGLRSIYVQFANERGSILSMSQSFYLNVEFVYGQKSGSITLSSLADSLAMENNLVYNNGYTVVYSS
jgi:hypothetical protein